MYWGLLTLYYIYWHYAIFLLFPFFVNLTFYRIHELQCLYHSSVFYILIKSFILFKCFIFDCMCLCVWHILNKETTTTTNIYCVRVTVNTYQYGGDHLTLHLQVTIFTTIRSHYCSALVESVRPLGHNTLAVYSHSSMTALHRPARCAAPEVCGFHSASVRCQATITRKDPQTGARPGVCGITHRIRLSTHQSAKLLSMLILFIL